jgi:glyoxylase-like metal-dependent hydrolase (beta-lactamase superfamily II)
MKRTPLSVLALLVAFATPAVAQTPWMIEEGITKRLSEHVWVIDSKGRRAVPNVGIVVGTKATLVIDTGLGRANGEIVLREAMKVTKAQQLYLAATHFHPEHIGGEQAFPAEAISVRARAQQDEVLTIGPRFIALFSGFDATTKELLKDHKFRAPGIVFAEEFTLDLGGVTVRFYWFGPAHTAGDTLFHVVEDGVLFTGDVVQKQRIPAIAEVGGSGTSWIRIVDRIEALKPKHIVPAHSELADASIIAPQREVLTTIRDRVADFKKRGVPLTEASEVLAKELEAKYAGWGNPNAIRRAVAYFYAAP